MSIKLCFRYNTNRVFVFTNINYHFDFLLILKTYLSIEKFSADATPVHLTEDEYQKENGRVVNKIKVEEVHETKVSLQSTSSTL